MIMNEIFNKIKRTLKKLLKNKNFNSRKYWEERYIKGGNSGAGSYNRLAEFKADILNDFVMKNNINRVIEYGCGDGNNLSLFKFKNYIGYDVSKTCIDLCKNKFGNDNTKEFYLINKNIPTIKAELVISLDVIYHLIEDKVFEKYINDLINSSERFVIIYASNKEEQSSSIHVKHRKFTDYIAKHFPNLQQIDFIKNKYSFDDSDPDNTSFADFYIFKKIN